MKKIWVIIGTVFIITLLFATAKRFGYTLKIDKTPAVKDQPSVNDTLYPDHSIPESNIEWFMDKTRIKKGYLTSFIATYTVNGKIIAVSNEPGRIAGLKYYYTGEKGYYYYYGKLTLQSLRSGTISSQDAYFSKKRMEILKVYQVTNQGLIEKSFSDLKAGKFIEIKEAVDLSISNIDDINVLFLTIKILSQ